MIRFLTLFASFRQDRRGVTALEYAIIAGVLGVTIATAFTSFGTSLSSTMTSVAGKL
jgi:Flp pilus assembly pilin Flp